MVMVTYYRQYIGVSTDEKPKANVLPGSRFLETDTQDVFIYDGTNWIKLTTAFF
ncbi:hypothetical protein SPSYN_02013 [Sporotomaculum syntrophicum]|uniref:Uncharacterized protein n=1 Tax=Sporotomaculum syntrophicum TaxID=182264 RepID=A0A9D2WPS1_9FIRM|nr:hypothetical protein [Sporotomaculum syntrophicum]KAF1084843.1 hypothetical protein SPSYN_02013 [Sporotomaculum syntrophicum]